MHSLAWAYYGAAVRKVPKASRARVVHTTRWSADEWAVVEEKAKAANVTPSEYVRAKALNMSPMALRWRSLSKTRAA